MSLTGPGPQHAPHGPLADRFDCLEHLRVEDQVLQVAGEYPGLLDRLEDFPSFRRGAAEGFRAEHSLARLCRQEDCLPVLRIGQADHDHVSIRVVDGRRHVGCPLLHPQGGRGFPGPVRGARIQYVHTVSAPVGMERAGVERAYQATAQHGDFVHWSIAGAVSLSATRSQHLLSNCACGFPAHSLPMSSPDCACAK